ncbi:MAG TPA: hypothetical protein VIG51_00720 [Candidatus Baltobacteraceae bacterium]|jgi:hypothetical protein
MERLLAAPYNHYVHHSALARKAAAGALALAFILIAPAPAATPPQILSAGKAPVLNVQVRQGSVTITTWGRPEVGVSAPDGVDVRHYDAQQVAGTLRRGAISFVSRTVNSRDGAVTLPGETFSLASVSAGPHEGVDVRSTANTPVDIQISVPADTALVVTRIGRGKVTLQNYRGGTFAMSVHTGGIFLQRVGGNGYAQVVRGPIVAIDSSFDQLRARTAVGNVLFERCSTRQIQVSSIEGSIVYDNGSFAPGLARFESQRGNVAVGVGAGNAQIGAHSSSGKVYSNFDRRAGVTGNGTDTQATLGTGGPVVTASSQSGSVYLYDGSFAQHRKRVGNAWRPMARAIHRTRAFRPPHRPPIHHP